MANNSNGKSTKRGFFQRNHCSSGTAAAWQSWPDLHRKNREMVGGIYWDIVQFPETDGILMGISWEYIGIYMAYEWDIIGWLVVSTYPFEKWWSESQLGWHDIPNWMEKSKMFQTTNQEFIDWTNKMKSVPSIQNLRLLHNHRWCSIQIRKTDQSHAWVQNFQDIVRNLFSNQHVPFVSFFELSTIIDYKRSTLFGVPGTYYTSVVVGVMSIVIYPYKA